MKVVLYWVVEYIGLRMQCKRCSSLTIEDPDGLECGVVRFRVLLLKPQFVVVDPKRIFKGQTRDDRTGGCGGWDAVDKSDRLDVDPTRPVARRIDFEFERQFVDDLELAREVIEHRSVTAFPLDLHLF